jgi:TIR domain-containing protein
MPDIFITYLPSLISQAISFNSCFISYSNADLIFASKLYRNLRDEGVQCWFAPEDLIIGDRIRNAIDESIHLHDKLLLVLSRKSIESQWVESEVEEALAREREQGYKVLFPIRLDDSIMRIYKGWPALIKNTRNIGDFTGWDNDETYESSFNRLLRDLKKA